MRLCLFGASPDTFNLGVSALFLSVIKSVMDRYPKGDVTVFDHGRGVREDEVRFGTQTFRLVRCGANLSRRYYRRDSLLNMRISAALGGLANPGVRAMAQANAVLDLSGGDSFTDLYGDRRFRAMTQPKQMALRLGTPLILMPQTYGPFERAETWQMAREIAGRASMAWARDHRNFETLRELLGDNFDAGRHREGVDVAFALPTKRPTHLVPGLESWLADRGRPLAGFNVSGLIFNQGAQGSRQFGFKSDYREIVHRILRRLLDESDARIVLVPHVLAPAGHYESDLAACRQVAEHLDNEDRTLVVESQYDAMEMKWVIAQLDFFCGTRMHSTIAGLSSSVPTAAIAYSKKTLGVFESCGQGACVTDPRQGSAEECTADVWRVWLRRADIRSSMVAPVADVVGRAARQSVDIFDHIERIERPTSGAA